MEMKDAILEILLDKIKATQHDFYPTGIEGLPQSAREISEMISEWTEFVIDSVGFNGNERTYFVYNPSKYETRKAIFKGINDVFNYWFYEIYKKQ